MLLARDGRSVLRVLLQAPHVSLPQAIVLMPCGAVAVTSFAPGWGLTITHVRDAWVPDLTGIAEMKVAGLLSLDLPPDFAVPDPNAPSLDEDPLEADAPEFHVDFLGEDEADSIIR